MIERDEEYSELTLTQGIDLMNKGIDCYSIDGSGKLRVGSIERIELVGDKIKVFISDLPISPIDLWLIGKSKKHAKILRLVWDVEKLDDEITDRNIKKENYQRDLLNILQEEKGNV